MNVRLVGFDKIEDDTYRFPGLHLEGLLRMPNIRPEISIGNILSIAVSSVTLLSLVVTLAVYGTTLRADLNSHTREIASIKASLEKQSGLNDQNLTAQTEVRVELRYIRSSLERIEKSVPSK